jgi:hypothetical protein
MLQMPSKIAKEILDLATFIEELPPGRYSQRNYHDGHGTRCICGWQNYRKGRIKQDDWEEAADDLGLSLHEAEDLFRAYPWETVAEPTARDAARVLRHLAVTGEVDWYFQRTEFVYS